MFGARAATEMSLDELLVLEKHLEIWIYQIRSTKVLNYSLLASNYYYYYYYYIVRKSN